MTFSLDNKGKDKVFLSRNGEELEMIQASKVGGYNLFLMSDGEWRFPNGKFRRATSGPLDIVEALTSTTPTEKTQL